MRPGALSLPVRRWRKVFGRLARQGARALRRWRPDAQRDRLARAFDRDFYLRRNPDVAAAGLDPLDHFLVFGWREGRDPTAEFSIFDYRALNPDVAVTDENPFVHYVLCGRAEGRAAKQDLGFRYDIVARLTPLEARLAAARARAEPRRAGAGAKLDAALARSRSGLGDLHLTFSHDDYAQNLGGLQLCVQREAEALAALGVDHLHVFPADAYPVVRSGPEAGLLGVVWNGALAGYFTAATVAAALAAAPAGQRSFAIHSLLGLSSADVLSVLGAAGLRAGYFWIHDFASLCAGFHLLRNDVADCGAPAPDSAACAVCIYQPYRAAHVEEHMRLFAALDLTVAAPSQSALDTWLGGAAFPHAGVVVLPHATLALRAAPPPPPRQDGVLKVAFLGLPSAHKGWAVFSHLAARFGEDPRYAFLHLGRVDQNAAVEFHEVTVGRDRPLAMSETLAALDVDVALIWPLCRETFCLTAYEAVAAGAAVLTNPDSGNVAAFVQTGGHGLVAAGEAELAELFDSGEVLALARAERRPRLYDLTFSTLSAELRAGPAAGPAS